MKRIVYKGRLELAVGLGKRASDPSHVTSSQSLVGRALPECERTDQVNKYTLDFERLPVEQKIMRRNELDLEIAMRYRTRVVLTSVGLLLVFAVLVGCDVQLFSGEQLTQSK